MAIAYARTQAHTRSKGHGAVAASAYRSGTRMVDERTGKTHDYSHRRDDVLHDKLTTSGPTPDWDRAQLWNAHEKSANRKNSQVCRDHVLALPHDLKLEGWTSVTQEYAQYIADRHGVAVDIAIHKANGKDARNTHAHLLLSTHRLGPEGFTEIARELSVKSRKEIDKTTGKPFGKTGGDILKEWRGQWQSIVNRELERSGSKERIDMRSYEEQGISKEAQKHLGPEWIQFDRKMEAANDPERSYRTQFNEGVKERNAANGKVNGLKEQAKVIDLEIEREKRRIREAVPVKAQFSKSADAKTEKPKAAAERYANAEPYDRDAEAIGQDARLERAAMEYAKEEAATGKLTATERREREQQARAEIKANAAKAELQNRHLEEAGVFGNSQLSDELAHRDALKERYGDSLREDWAKAEALQEKLDNGGLWYRFRHAKNDRAELEGVRLNIADSMQRLKEEYRAFKLREQQGREAFEAKQQVERQKAEVRIEQKIIPQQRAQPPPERAYQRTSPAPANDLSRDERLRQSAAKEATQQPERKQDDQAAIARQQAVEQIRQRREKSRDDRGFER